MKGKENSPLDLVLTKEGRVILALLQSSEEVFQAEIAEKAGLSKATAFRSVAKLVEKDVLIEKKRNRMIFYTLHAGVRQRLHETFQVFLSLLKDESLIESYILEGDIEKAVRAAESVGRGLTPEELNRVVKASQQ